MPLLIFSSGFGRTARSRFPHNKLLTTPNLTSSRSSHCFSSSLSSVFTQSCVFSSVVQQLEPIILKRVLLSAARLLSAVCAPYLVPHGSLSCSPLSEHHFWPRLFSLKLQSSSDDRAGLQRRGPCNVVFTIKVFIVVFRISTTLGRPSTTLGPSRRAASSCHPPRVPTPIASPRAALSAALSPFERRLQIVSKSSSQLSSFSSGDVDRLTESSSFSGSHLS